MTKIVIVMSSTVETLINGIKGLSFNPIIKGIMSKKFI
jgi:hypothetical protein